MPPKNIQRIDHLVFIVRPENLAAAVAEFEEVLGISFEGPHEPAGHTVRVCIDWEAGIEIYSPLNPDDDSEQSIFLREHGEGIFRLIFGVANLDDTVERLESIGRKPYLRYNGINVGPDWKDRFSVVDEAFIKPLHGSRIGFGQIDPR